MIHHLHRLIRRAAATALLMLGAAAHAQYASDIDIYAGPLASTAAPNVLIIVDNTANWNSKFTSEMSALIASMNNLPLDRIRVGLMMFTETGGGNSGADGGYVRSAMRLVNVDYQTKFKALLASLDVGNDKSNGGKAALTMAETYYYFAGMAPNSGNNKSKTDFLGNTSGTAASQAVYALPANALLAKGGTRYSSAILDPCQRNYIIYISNGAVQDNASDTSDSSSRLTAAYAAAGMTRPPDITLSPSGSQSGVSDEWARFLKASNMGISTYTVDVDKITT
ncbi:MAG: pilus assembly protein PilY, partial [Bdellovibrionales bacterium]|nr:pilus assembly protein PilY [Ramlibacter sp.]